VEQVPREAHRRDKGKEDLEVENTLTGRHRFFNAIILCVYLELGLSIEFSS